MNQRIFKFFAITLIIGFITASHINFTSRVNAQEKIRPQPAIVDCHTSSPFDELNQVMQTRFLNWEKGFGYERLNPFEMTQLSSRHERRTLVAVKSNDIFSPESSEEAIAINSLKTQRMKLGVFLASRWAGFLLSPKSFEQKEKLEPGVVYLSQSPIVSVIKGPVVVTHADFLDSYPEITNKEFVAKVQMAVKAFESSDSFLFNADGWNIEARPVRATMESCVECHNSRFADMQYSLPDSNEKKLNVNKVKIGDTLGVLLYTYKENKASK